MVIIAASSFWELFFQNIFGVCLLVIAIGWTATWVVDSLRGNDKEAKEDTSSCQCSCGYVHSPDDFDRHYESAIDNDLPANHIRLG